MKKIVCAFLLQCSALAAFAAVFGNIHGIVHDPQHRPISGAQVTVKAALSDLTFRATTNPDGSFSVAAIPQGKYIVTITDPGFASLTEPVSVDAQAETLMHLQLPLATVSEAVTVDAAEAVTNVRTVTPTMQSDRIDIAHTPGADRTNSLAIITDYVPGAYETHDMLHMRGGHQVSWLIDGVQIPNTNIASNIAPQIDPKDIDTLQVDRGSYPASLGDRTYGIFDVVPRSGFERQRDAELMLSAGSQFQTNDQLSLGDHTDRFAWYASANGNRSDYGLQAPTARFQHDAENGYGAFGNVLYNLRPTDQIRYVGQARTDYYQIPYDPDPNSWENQLYDSSGLRDTERETDSYGAATWLHTFSPNSVAQVSPFYHYNRATYTPNSQDQPAATSAVQSGLYLGGQASAQTTVARNTISGGMYGYWQHEADRFSAVFNDGSAASFGIAPLVTAGVTEAFVEDRYAPTSWLTLIGGERISHFTGAVEETAAYPRIGIAVQIPRLNWVFRAFYGHFYQPPPLTSISGTALAYAQTNNDSYVPLRGERDEEHQFGVQIPFHGWVLDADTFQTEASNFLDHNNIGESSIFIPVTVQGALIQGWELTLNSPQLWRFGHAHLSYSNQIAQQQGGITGGLVCYDPTNSGICAVPPGYTPLDHGQRNTLNFGMNANLPHHTFGSFNVYYGSGFSNGYTDPPSPYSGEYLPSHTTADLSLGHDFGQRVTAAVHAMNVGNTRVLLDNSLTFGGFHYNNPRQIYGEIRYRFKF